MWPVVASSCHHVFPITTGLGCASCEPKQTLFPTSLSLGYFWWGSGSELRIIRKSGGKRQGVAESEPRIVNRQNPFGRQLNAKLPFDLAIFLRGINSRRMKIHVRPKMCAQILIASLFAGSKTQKEKPTLSTIAKCNLFLQWSICPIHRKGRSPDHSSVGTNLKHVSRTTCSLSVIVCVGLWTDTEGWWWIIL